MILHPIINNSIRFAKAGRPLVVWVAMSGLLFWLIPPRASKHMIIGNYGLQFYRTFLVVDILTYVLFGLFVSLIIYKFVIFRDQKNTNKPSSRLAGVGGMIGTLIGGCSACTLGRLGYAGLATFMMALPFSGGEIKVLSLMLLSRVTVSLLSKLYQCNKLPRPKG